MIKVYDQYKNYIKHEPEQLIDIKYSINLCFSSCSLKKKINLNNKFLEVSQVPNNFDIWKGKSMSFYCLLESHLKFIYLGIFWFALVINLGLGMTWICLLRLAWYFRPLWEYNFSLYDLTAMKVKLPDSGRWGGGN